ncbi:MAG: DUF2441 domain-containing protein [Deltaproteobacteria bacterium]|nr:DUF2441 domain-containing protein [Deltaproteobacteria bacterium]
MREVDGEEFWHLARPRPGGREVRLTEGLRLYTGLDYNPFHRHLYKKAYLCRGNRQYILSGLLNRRDELLADPAQLYDLALTGLRHATLQLRERIMEEVRAADFPDHPSRLRCFWLADSPDSVTYWRNKLGSIAGQGLTLWRVAARGRVHLGSNRWVKNDSLSLETYYHNARQYWAGRDVGGAADELVLEGELTLLHHCDLETLEPLPPGR